MNTNTHQVSSKELSELLKFFSNTHYKSKDADKRTQQIEDVCISLISKDYPNHIVIENENGQLSNSYPSKIIIPEIEEMLTPITRSNTLVNDVPSQQQNGVKNLTTKTRRLETDKLKDLMCKARVARCRARFPIPVILYKNKYICRSATLSSGAEIYGRSVYDYTFNDNKNYSQNVEFIKTIDKDDEEFVEAIVDDSPPLPHSLTIGDSCQMFSIVRNQDIKLLKYFSVKYIFDLMLENKKVKFGLNVTSSEKADKMNRYSNFNITSLPYPGCEFFREYRDNRYCGEGLIYNWNQNFVDAKFDLPNCEEISKQLRINFKEYRSWDIIKLTQNYVKLLVHFVKTLDSSILIHCISGWDRTPLFMSLLRLTLWADGEIHKNLSAIEITYLTVAYDWFLFGHNLNDRLNKGEEIMFFCFQFLKFLTGDEFNINYEYPKTVDNCNDTRRKISVDSYSNGYDFMIDNIPTNYGGSCTSLNSTNSSICQDPPLFFSVNHDNKHDDCFTTSLSSCEMDKLKICQHDNTTSFSEKDDPNYCESSKNEMISTLTSSNLGSSDGSSPQSSQMSSYESSLHSSTQPVEIPNAKNNSFQILGDGSLNSLCRSDSWQFVSEAGSIRDQHLSNLYSSPDSLNSLHRKSISPSCQSETRSPKPSRRKDNLLEVRSLFNSAYTSLSYNNNGCRFTNLVDHFVGRVYSNRETPE